MRTWVVGGGIVGAAVGFEGARRGHAVGWIDDASRPGISTAAAAGMLAPYSEAEDVDERLLAFALDSLGRSRELVRLADAASGRDSGYRDEGTLWIAGDRDDLLDLRHRAETLERRGHRVDELSPQQLSSLEPGLSPRLAGGLSMPDDHQVDPLAWTRSLHAATLAAGARRRSGSVLRVVEEEGRVVGLDVEEPGGGTTRVDASRIVLAAGCWTPELLPEGNGLPPVRPLRGQLIRLHGEPLISRVVRHPDVYLVPRRDGELLVGATMEERGLDARATAGGVYEHLRWAHRLLPGVDELEFVEVSVGLRPASADNRPVIGPLGLEGLWGAYGHGRSGVLLAAGTAHHLWEAIEGRPTDLAQGMGARRAAPAAGEGR